MKMKRKILSMVLVMAFVMSLLPMAAVYAAETVTATPTSATVFIDGVAVDFTAFNIDGRNYFMLRDVAYALSGTPAQFDVEWVPTFPIYARMFDVEWTPELSARGRISIRREQYTPVGGEMAVAIQGDRQAVPVFQTLYPYLGYIESEHSDPDLPDGARFAGSVGRDGNWLTWYAMGPTMHLSGYNIDGNNFFAIRDLAMYLDFGLSWDGDANAISIDTSRGHFNTSTIIRECQNGLYRMELWDYIGTIEPFIETFEGGGSAFNPGATLFIPRPGNYAVGRIFPVAGNYIIPVRDNFNYVMPNSGIRELREYIELPSELLFIGHHASFIVTDSFSGFDGYWSPWWIFDDGVSSATHILTWTEEDRRVDEDRRYLPGRGIWFSDEDATRHYLDEDIFYIHSPTRARNFVALSLRDIREILETGTHSWHRNLPGLHELILAAME
jgi:hypothetical protein